MTGTVVGVQGSRFKVQGSRFKVQGSRFKVQGSKIVEISIDNINSKNHCHPEFISGSTHRECESQTTPPN
jgi:hypothetical protein